MSNEPWPPPLPPQYPPPPPPPGYLPPAYYPAQGPTDVLGHPLATWWQRVGALVLDWLVVGIPGAILLFIAGSATSSTNYDPATGLSSKSVGPGYWIVFLIVVAAQFAYFSLLDGNSQSVGKRAVGIAVRSKKTGEPIGSGRALWRWLLYSVLWYAFFVPGLLNSLSPLWDKSRQAWHDHAVDSVVVKVSPN